MTTHYLGATMDFLASNLAYILIALFAITIGSCAYADHKAGYLSNPFKK
jgi:hypothetical protein